MTCLRCQETGYLRDRSPCTCDARPFDAGSSRGPTDWSDDQLAFLLRLREQANPGSNATPESHDQPVPPELDLEPAAPMSKADSLVERAKRMGRPS